MARSRPAPQRSAEQQRQLDRALSGNFTGLARENARGGTPTMQEERDAALSGNFSNVIAQTDRSAPVNNGAWGAYVPVEKPSNAVLQGLNELGFSVNVEKKKGLPKGSYASKDLLQEHSYEVSERENQFLREAFNQPTVITGDGGSIGTISGSMARACSSRTEAPPTLARWT